MSADVGSHVSSSNVKCHTNQSNAAVVALLKERRRVLRQRSKLLLARLPVASAHGADGASSPLSANPDSMMHHDETRAVVAAEVKRIAWDPVMELSHLVFWICRASWEHQHQQSMEAVRQYHVHVVSRRSGSDAWERLLGQQEQSTGLLGTDKNPAVAVGSAEPVVQHRATALIPSTMTTKAPPARHLQIVEHEDLCGHHNNGPTQSSAHDDKSASLASSIASQPDNALLCSDDELDTLVALKYAERRNAARAAGGN